jgi:tetratricopeptide (TPR) repeat protein
MAISGLIILAVLLLVAYRKRADRAVFFSISWFIITLLPVSNIYKINAYMAEHWLYLPSVGVFVMFGRIAVLMSKKSENAMIFVTVSIVILTAFYGYLTVKQNNYWMDPIAFYEKTLKYVPDAWRIHLNLGYEYSKINQSEKALQAFKKTIDLNPSSVDAYNNIANIYQKAGRHDEAIGLYKKAVAINPTYYGGYYNLGDEYSQIGNTSEAIACYKKALELYPNYADAYNNLGILYSGIGKYDEAIESFKKAITINPNHAARKNLGILYKRAGRSDDKAGK